MWILGKFRLENTVWIIRKWTESPVRMTAGNTVDQIEI